MGTEPVELPSFVAGSALLEAAYRLAEELHHGPRRSGDTDIDHPCEVALLLAQAGFEERVVAAALLHDVIEDTETSVEEIEAHFGSAIAGLVREMTEDEAISSYRQRKAEHRGRVVEDRRVAAIYAADKVANARSLSGQDADAAPEKVEHYLNTLLLLEREHPELPFLRPLREELLRLGGHGYRRRLGSRP